MSRQRAMYVGQSVADELLDSVDVNLDRYFDGDFTDLADAGNWSIPLRIEFELDILNQLNPMVSPDIEIENSKLVWRALHGLTPTLARENRIWVRISHLNCLDFCRQRWLGDKTGDALAKSARKHMFANTLTKARDDHAISRLWWNYWIASQALPQDTDLALSLLLKSADIRSNLVERPWIFSRHSLASGIFRLLASDTWPMEYEKNFREFMKAINLHGSGIVFEVLGDSDTDDFMRRCADQAKNALAK